MKLIEEPNCVIIEEKGDTFMIGFAAASLAFTTLITIGVLSSDAGSTAIVSLILVFSPFVILALFFLPKPYKYRYVFDNIEGQYSIEIANIFRVKGVTGELQRIKLVQVTTWEESSENVSDWSVYSVKLVFDDDPSSSPGLKQYRFVSDTLQPDLPMRVATAISTLLRLPEPRIEKINPSEESFKETDDWFGNVAKRFDKRFR